MDSRVLSLTDESNIAVKLVSQFSPRDSCPFLDRQLLKRVPFEKQADGSEGGDLRHKPHHHSMRFTGISDGTSQAVKNLYLAVSEMCRLVRHGVGNLNPRFIVGVRPLVGGLGKCYTHLCSLTVFAGDTERPPLSRRVKSAPNNIHNAAGIHGCHL